MWVAGPRLGVACGVACVELFSSLPSFSVPLTCLPSPSRLVFCFNRFKRGLKRKPMALVKKLRKAKKEASGMEKPETVRTHLRNMVIVPEMIGSVVGVYNGKVFNTVEIKPEMVGTYLGEYAITYRPVAHGRAGIGATNSSRFIPLK